MAERKNATSEHVYRQLREQILHLELSPGTAISEIETAAKYQVSRTPVRDAFKALEAEGLLEIRPHIGTFVSLIDLRTVSDILFARCTLEKAVYKDLAMTLDKSQEYRIHLLLQKQEEILFSDLSSEELSRAFILSDNAFHYALYDLTGKQNIMHFYSAINAQYERFRTFINLSGREELKKLYHEHTAIWNHILNKEFDALEDCITQHLYNGFNASMKVISNYPEYFLAETKESL